MNISKVLVVCYKDNFGTESVVRKALQKEGICHHCINRDSLSASRLRGYDLIITVGGDGTFLRTAQYVKSQPILCVASSLKKNEGFFSRASKDDFAKKLKLVLEGKHKIIKLNRLEPVISRKGKKERIESAVNEVFIGNSRPYLTSRYVLQIGKKKELQKSSGIIIATAAGSSAWARSAGGKKLPFTSRKIQYVVREPYSGRLTRPKMVKGILPEGTKIEIKSLDWHGIAAVDSHHHEHDLREGATISIRNSKNPMNFIDF